MKRKALLKRRRGATLIMMIGVGAVICLLGLFFLELQTLYDYHYSIEVRAQRAVNSALEYCMDDRYRADGLLYVPATDDTRRTVREFLNESLNVDSSGVCRDGNGNQLYRVRYSTPYIISGGPGTNPRIEITLTVNMTAGIGRAYGFGTGYDWQETFSSTNFRTDDNYRAGTW